MRRKFTSTYRLQLNSDFTFADAEARVPYLAKLGISHVYCSPIMTARTGSTHGYDVTDPTTINAALGGEAGFVALAECAHRHGLGLLVDIVPNHMGVSSENAWWEDLLHNGRNSKYAEWFDVAWKDHRLILPVLGDSLEKVLERRELSYDADARRLKYFSHSFPVSEPAQQFDDISRLIQKQHYSLVYWKDGQRDLNYRRFFDVNDLAAIRVDRVEVFQATHAYLLDLVRRGLVDGVRVDHIDGLLDPREYLKRLVSELRHAAGEAIHVFVEKILAPDERLPRGWASGTTGYEFLTAVDDFLIDSRGFQGLAHHYGAADFGNIAAESKRKLLRTTLNPDVRRLAPILRKLAAASGSERLTTAQCAAAMIEFIALLPVYRTYLSESCPAGSDHDRSLITAAIGKAIEEGRAPSAALLQLQHVLLDDWSSSTNELQGERLACVLRLQQLSGPAAAKGVEDTALYNFAPLASRSEVGGDPGAPLENASVRLHSMILNRAEHIPFSLNAVSTHDTKRSADARARINALSDHADEWIRLLRRWTRRHRPLQQKVKSGPTPNSRLQNYIYQSLVAVWPLVPILESPVNTLESIRERVSEYMLKATRESKLTTSWTEPDMQFEAAIAAFLKSILSERDNHAFLREMDGFVKTITESTNNNVIVREVLHLTAVGTPDIYQGDELWFSALVDPDNRRAVDWKAREMLLDDVMSASLPALSGNRDISWIKLAIIHKLLHLKNTEMAFQGLYEPLCVSGDAANSIFAFRRRSGESPDMVIAVRRNPGAAGIGGTSLVAHAEADLRGTWTCVLQDITVTAENGLLPLARLLSAFPASVLVKTS